MKFTTAVTDSLHRVTPHDVPKTSLRSVIAARGERISFQVLVRADHLESVDATVSINAPKYIKTRVRRVGYIPVPHLNKPLTQGHHEGLLPGYVGDPLFEEEVSQLYPGETVSFWITVDIDEKCPPGEHRLGIVTKVNDKTRGNALVVQVAGVNINRRRNFPVTNWFYADALLDYYNLKSFDKNFWRIAENYIRNMSEHYQDVIYVPALTPSLDGFKRPTQLLKVTRQDNGRYKFDWSDVRKWIELASRHGITHFEFSHLFTQWGCKHGVMVYENQGVDEKPLWPRETPALSETYRTFLSQFLPQLKRFCEKQGILNRSFFHISDEPHGEEQRASYLQAKTLVAELAPWMKVMDALSEREFSTMVDMPIVSISTINEYIAPKVGEPVPCWAYYCCHPKGKYLNRLMDTPLSKIRMHGWMFHKTGVLGFLHWGYNYWYRSQTRELIDPFSVSNAMNPNWAYGDTFMVYPGPDGPIDSVRWEVFAESLQDYALLQTLGVSSDDNLLKDLRGYDDFPFSPNWIASARKKLLTQ